MTTWGARPAGPGRSAAGRGRRPGPAVSAARPGSRRRRRTRSPSPRPRGWSWRLGLAAAFVVAQHTSGLRADERAGTWVLRQLAVIRTPWLTDVANGINVAGSGWGARVLGLSVVALTIAFRRWRHLAVFVGGLLFLDFAGTWIYPRWRGHARTACRSSAAGAGPRARRRRWRPSRSAAGRGLLPGRARPGPLPRQGGRGRRGRRIRPGPPVPGGRSPRDSCSARRWRWRSRSPRSVTSPRTRCSRSPTGAAAPRTWT